MFVCSSTDIDETGGLLIQQPTATEEPEPTPDPEPEPDEEGGEEEQTEWP